MHHHQHHGADDLAHGAPTPWVRQPSAWITVAVLLLLAGATVWALVALWPHDVAAHIRSADLQGSAVGLTTSTGKVVGVAEQLCVDMPGSWPGAPQTCAELTVHLLDGPDRGQEVMVMIDAARYGSGVDIGTRVKLFRTDGPGGLGDYTFNDFDRTIPLLVVGAVFVAVVVLVARLRGLLSLLGLVFAGFVAVKFMFPAMISGTDPTLVGLVGSTAIMLVVLYTTHGFSRRTTTALVGTMFGLGLSAVLGWVTARWAHLTGVSGEDDYLLAGTAPDLQLSAVVTCGIIVAGLGVLNDVTITQASAVWELADAGEGRHSALRLFRQAMRIGRDHIASTVYTIAFATMGAALATMLLIVIFEQPLLQVIQTEQLAEELLRTMVASIALVLAVPLTTLVGVIAVRAAPRRGRHRPAETAT